MPKTKRRADATRPVHVYEAAMRVGNKDHEAAFLEPIPHAARPELLTMIHGGGFGRLWDVETCRDFWLASDGKHAVCLTLAGLDIRRAAQVRAYFDAHCRDHNGEPAEFGANVLTGIVRHLRSTAWSLQ